MSILMRADLASAGYRRETSWRAASASRRFLSLTLKFNLQSWAFQKKCTYSVRSVTRLLFLNHKSQGTLAAFQGTTGAAVGTAVGQPEAGGGGAGSWAPAAPAINHIKKTILNFIPDSFTRIGKDGGG